VLIPLIAIVIIAITIAIETKTTLPQKTENRILLTLEEMTTLKVRKVLNEMKATSVMMILKRMMDLERMTDLRGIMGTSAMIITIEMKAIENLTRSLMATTKAIPLQ